MRRDKNKKQNQEKPNIYGYHDYRDFLKDFLQYRIDSSEKFSLRRLARLADISSGYLPMVINGKRNLTMKALIKLEPHLGLSESEMSYLKQLQILSDSNSQAERLKALKKMQTFNRYTRVHNDEVRAFNFLTHWYNIVIREMVQLKDFNLDVEWIKGKLINKVSKQNIRDATSFLLNNDFIKSENNKVTQTVRDLNCVGSVYKVGLKEFHKSMFDLASKSIDLVPSDKRSIVGHTLSISENQFKEVKNILDEALDKISKIENKKENNEVVYHTSLVAFPLTTLNDEVENETND
jgi:uncharacterized protein (TIGR02147 family)